MSKKHLIQLILAVVISVFVTGVCGFAIYASKLPDYLSQHETIIIGQSLFTPGSQASLRLLVRDSRDASPLEGAKLKILLKPATGGQELVLYSGETNPQGTADVQFDVPEGYEQAPRC
jgi:hypothetical protein